MSIGLGRYEPLSFDDDGEKDPKSLSIGDKFSKLVWSATDTETVHSTLQDLLPPSTYFRINPYLSGKTAYDFVKFGHFFISLAFFLSRNVLLGRDPSWETASNGVGRQTFLPSEPEPSRQSVRPTHSQTLVCAELTEKIQTAECNMINTSSSPVPFCNILYLISKLLYF